MKAFTNKNNIKMMDCRTDLPVLLLADVNPHWPQEDIQEQMTKPEILMNSMREVGHLVTRIYLEAEELPEALLHYKPAEAVVFNLCDKAPGIPCSCWLIAQKLEQCGFTFTGADSAALILSQDKRQIMRQLQRHGVNVPQWEEYTSPENVTWEKYPAIVKPGFEQYSNGITRESVSQTPLELINRIRYVLEEFIDGRVFHVAVIGNSPPIMLPPAEIDYSSFSDIHDRLLAYQSKFDKTSLAYCQIVPRFPVELTTDQLRILNDMVITAYQATGCRDYARMDIRLRGDVFCILDVNHNANLCPETGYVLGAEWVGLYYGQLGSLLVNLAAHRHEVFGNSKRENPLKNGERSFYVQ